MEKTYGKEPIFIRSHIIECEEIFFYQYMPIKFPSMTISEACVVSLPEQLHLFTPLLIEIECKLGQEYLKDKYVYITAKHNYVTPQYWGNRPGWHTDGFGTDDINFIWCDYNPTIFNSSDFKITDDHAISLKEFEQQAKPENNFRYMHYDLLMLDQYVVHKVAPVIEGRFRTFVKISISKDAYNLKHNTHNYLLTYDWNMKERQRERNNPTKL